MNYPKVSLVMATFNRPLQLRWGLWSIAREPIPYPFEVIVVNDGNPADETKSICDNFSTLNVRYICTNRENYTAFRNPAVVNNIAIKQSTGDIVILTCPEIYHLNSAVQCAVAPILDFKNTISVPHFMYFDENGTFLKALPNERIAVCKKWGFVKTQFPFFMGIWKEQLLKIGGYDEEYTGYALEDDDLILRFRRMKLRYFRSLAKVVHVWHEDVRKTPGWHEKNQLNKNLFARKKSEDVVRNRGLEWGNYDCRVS